LVGIGDHAVADDNALAGLELNLQRHCDVLEMGVSPTWVCPRHGDVFAAATRECLAILVKNGLTQHGR
jgi:hypothetical protein